VSETGSVKFTCDQVAVKATPFAGMVELNEHRRKLQELGLIGVDARGIGFGNLSIRDGATNKFYITGSMTGGKPALDLTDYARVVSYDFGRNWLRCEGSTIASSIVTGGGRCRSNGQSRLPCHSCCGKGARWRYRQHRRRWIMARLKWCSRYDIFSKIQM
jgi:hypothetical protein